MSQGQVHRPKIWPQKLLSLGLLGTFILGLASCEPKKSEDVTPKEPSERISTPAEAGFVEVAIETLPGFRLDTLHEALPALWQSCQYFTFQAKADKALTGPLAKLKAEQMLKPCESVARLMGQETKLSESEPIRNWLIENFHAYQVVNRASGEHLGLFTGYYEAEIQASETRDPIFHVPIFGRPKDLISVQLGDFDEKLRGQSIAGRIQGGALVPYHKRNEINTGILSSEEPLLYATDPLDLFIMQVQGSGRAQLPDGRVIRLGFQAHNGHAYRSIAKVLVQRGDLPADKVSWDDIRTWMQKNSSKAAALLAENPRYIFFQAKPLDPSLLADEIDGPIGSLGRPLTSQRSLAVDPEVIPLGLPMWLDLPGQGPGNEKLQRLVVAQDTGGAIKGVIRGDYFWGYGDVPRRSASKMRTRGSYYILLPKGTMISQEAKVAARPPAVSESDPKLKP